MIGPMGDNYLEAQISQHGAGSLLNTYTTAKRVINDQAVKRDLYAGFWCVGRMVEVKVRGVLSNIVTTPGTVQFLLKLGTEASPITVYDSGAIQLNATAHTTLPFWLDVLARVDSEGSGTNAKLFAHGRVGGIMFTKTAGQTDSAQGDQVIAVPQTAPVLGAGFDSTIVTQMDFWAGFSISNAGNGIRIDQFALIDLGIS
jgi:hypothetical protein